MKNINLNLDKIPDTYEITEDVTISSKFLGRNDDQLKSKVVFLHNKPNLKSKIISKAVLYDNSVFDFEGMLKIQKGSVDTDAYLKIDCLVMSESAYARAVPSLEINEDQVKGGHGATIGYPDPEQVGYLMSKGLSRDEALDLIVEAFLG